MTEFTLGRKSIVCATANPCVCDEREQVSYAQMAIFSRIYATW